MESISCVRLPCHSRRLLRSPPRQSSHTRYKYINFRQDRGQYQVHIPQTLSKCFATKREAITAACQATGTTRNALLLAPGHRLAGHYTKARTRDRCRQLFSALWKVYSCSSTGKPVVCIPSDLVAASQAAQKSKQMYQDSPAWLAICLRGKEGPFKEILRREWKSHRSGVQSSGVDPKLAHTCLQKVVRCMAAVARRKTLDAWATNIGKNVSHHSGWLATCQKLQVIAKVREDARGSGVLVLGKERARYKLLPYNAKSFGTAFKRNELLGSILQNMPIPTSTSEWVAAIKSARTDAAKRKYNWKSLAYLWPWMLRSHMIAQTRARGVHAMTYPRAFRCSELEAMAPDQRKHIAMLKDDITSVYDLFNLLGYNGPAELFSMFACMFLAKGSRQWDPTWVSDRVARLIKHRELMFARDGVQPHPLTLLQEFWDKHGHN